MKPLKYIFVLVFFITALSCKNEINSNNEVSTIALEEKLQNIEVSIEGMTCEIGCAKLIASKIYKLEGVTYTNVSFENKLGQFTFDSNKISSEEIFKNINGIAGGDLYTVTESQIVDKFSTIVTVIN